MLNPGGRWRVTGNWKLEMPVFCMRCRLIITQSQRRPFGCSIALRNGCVSACVMEGAVAVAVAGQQLENPEEVVRGESWANVSDCR